jgi:hypothetical protein
MAKTDAGDAPAIKPRTDAYTGMLLLSLIVLLVGCLLLYLDFSQYPTTKAPAPAKVSVGGPDTGGGAPAVPPGGAPGGAPK